MSIWHLIWIVPTCITIGWCLRVTIVRAQSGTIAEPMVIIDWNGRPCRAHRIYTEGERVDGEVPNR